MVKVPKLVSGGGKAPAKFSEFTKRKTRRRIPFISVSDVVFPDIVFACNPIKNFTNSKVGPDPVWSYTAPNYNDDGSYTGSTPWWNTDLSRWEWGGPSYTQYAQNSKFEGAGIGVSPAGWNTPTTTSNGITRRIVGFGPGYIDVRFSGTGTGSTAHTGVQPTSATYPIAALSETWTGNAKVTLLSGDWSAVNPRVEVQEATSANGYLVSSSASLIGKSGQIVSHTRALANASVGKCILSPFLTSITVGTSVDFTVRIERPQLTKTAAVMPYIATGIGETITCNSIPQPRIDAGKGLWGGPQVANLLPASAANSSTWAKTNCTLIANILTINAINGVHYVFLASVSYLSGASYTSAYRIRAGGGQRFVQVTGPGAAFNTAQYANFDLATGVVTSSPGCVARMFPDINGFYWCVYTCVALATVIASNPFVAFIPNGTAPRTPSYAGDGIASLEIDRWMVAESSVPVPYVPPGATQPHNYATTGNNGLNIPMDVGMLNCLGASGASAMTLMHEAYMGVGSADLVTNNGIVSCAIDEYSIIYMSNGNMITKSYDRSNSSLCSSTWNANEIHRRYAQTTPLFGGRFRVGYQRFTSSMVEITSGIQWSHPGAESTWATFDGSFNPLTYLRFGLNLSVPVWHRYFWMSNKTLFADEIALRNIKIANV